MEAARTILSGRISEAKVQEVSDCFDEFSERKGFLDKDDLKVAVTALLGFRPSKYEVQQMLASAAAEDPKCPGMSRGLFIDATARRLALVDPAEEIRQMFKAFDKGCRGFITRDDLRQVISQTFSDRDMTPAKVAEMFTEADWHGSGRIGYQQFESMVTGRFPKDFMWNNHRRPMFQSGPRVAEILQAPPTTDSARLNTEYELRGTSNNAEHR